MSESYHYVISGFGGDAHIYRHGKKVVELHKEINNYSGETFWDLSGKRTYQDSKWFIAIGRGDNVIGTCMVLPEDEGTYSLSNLCYDKKYSDENKEHLGEDLLRKACEYAHGYSLIAHAHNSNETYQNELKKLGASEVDTHKKDNYKTYLFTTSKRISK